MLKNLSQLEHVIENKSCKLICDVDCPLEYVKESLFQFLKYIGAVQDAIKAQQEKAAQEQAAKASVEEPKQE